MDEAEWPSFPASLLEAPAEEWGRCATAVDVLRVALFFPGFVSGETSVINEATRGIIRVYPGTTAVVCVV